MMFAAYPGHVAAAALLLGTLGLLAWSYRHPVARTAGWWRLLFGGLQYVTIVLLLLILWDLSRATYSDREARREVQVFFDTSRSMSVADVDGRERLDAAIALYREQLAGQAAPDVTFVLNGLDWQAYRAASTDQLRRWGDQTELRAALDQIRATRVRIGGASPEDAPASVPAGAVVFTDGQVDVKNASAYPPLTTGGDATPYDLVFVGLGEEQSALDLKVDRIEAPRQAAVDTAYTARVDVSAMLPDGVERADALVELYRDDALLQKLDVTLTAEAPATRLSADLAAGTLGTHVLEARIRTEGSAGPEPNIANNTRRTVVEVVDEQTLDVLLFTHVATHNVGRVRQALARDKKVRLHLGFDVIKPSRMIRRPSLMNGHVPLPGDLAGFLQYDVVILGPGVLDHLNPGQVDALYTFVTERGGGLVLMPGRGERTLVTNGNGKLYALIPVQPGEPRPAGPLATQALTFEGRHWRLVSEPELLEIMPEPVPFYTGVRKKPAASTLVRTGPVPVVAAHRVGRGYVCLLNDAELFQWYREDLEGGLLKDFLSGLTARIGGISRREAGVELYATRLRDNPYTVRYEAFVYDSRFAPVSAATVLLETPGVEAGVPVVLAMDEVEPGRYGALVEDMRDEAVTALAEAEKGGFFLGATRLTTTLPMPRGEMDDVTLDRAFLEAVADRLDGRYVAADDLGNVAGSLFEVDAERRQLAELRPIWRTWAMLLLLGGLLTASWFGRRAVGMV